MFTTGSARILLAAALLAGSAGPLHAQDGPLRSSVRFGHLGLEDGLAQSTVNAILQDRTGYIWLGTEDGLQLYDGYRFRTFRHIPDDPQSLSSSSITSLLEDPEHGIWIGTYNGLNLYNPANGSFRRFRHEHAGINSVSHAYIWALERGPEGKIWVATEQGLERLDPASGKWQLYRSGSGGPGQALLSDTIWSLLRDRTGTLWIGTSRGLNFLPPGAEKIQVFKGFPATPDVAGWGVNALLEDGRGRLWVGQQGALSRIGPQRGEVHVFQPGGKGDRNRNLIFALLQSRDGSVWAGTYGNGLLQLDPETGASRVYRHEAVDRFSLSGNQITRLYQDRSGIIWVGTATSGVNTYNPETRLFGHVRHMANEPDSLSDNTVWGFARDAVGNLWVATENGLNRQRKDGTFEHFLHSEDDPGSVASSFIGTLHRDAAGRLWIGTGFGLNLWLPESRTFRHFTMTVPEEDNGLANNISMIRDAGGGRLWVGTLAGLFRFDPETGKAEAFPTQTDTRPGLAGRLVLDIEARADGRFWVATEGGLTLFDPVEQAYRNFTSRSDTVPDLPHDYVHSLYLAPDGVLWLGTGGGLLAYDEKNGTQRLFTTVDGLANNTVYCVLADREGHLWLSTNNGLVHFDPAQAGFSQFGPVNGLQSREFNTSSCAAGPDGRLYFGGVNGFNAFSPEAVKKTGSPAEVIITDFHLPGSERSHFGVNFDADSRLTLTHRDDFFTIEFALLDFAAPQRNRFLYRLEGFDTEWLNAGTRNQASYTNLDPGDYRFQVRGISASGVPGSNTAELAIRVLPAPWLTWWAYAGYVTLALAALLLIFRGQVRRTEREHALQSEQQQRRWAETLHQLSQALAASLDARTVAAQLADHLARLVEFNIAALFVEQGTELVLAGSRGLAGQQERKLEQLPEVGARLLAEFRHVRKPVRFDSSYLPVRAFVEETPHIRQYLAIPLVSRSDELTLLLLGRSDNPFTDREVEIVTAFARQALHALDNARLFAEVQNLGTTDSLTRVHNRRFFFEQAELEFSRSKRYERELALLLLDADHFRDVNEYYGQDVGDRVMKLIAGVCRQNLRHFDIIGRYSGESFIVLLPETDLNVAADVADRLRKCVEEMRVETHRGELRVTISIGVAVSRNGETVPDLAALINKADMALYEAKRAGRNRVITG